MDKAEMLYKKFKNVVMMNMSCVENEEWLLFTLEGVLYVYIVRGSPDLTYGSGGETFLIINPLDAFLDDDII